MSYAKTAGKYICAFHINMPKCQESPLSMKTLRNTKEKSLASSLVNAGLSEKLSVEIHLSVIAEYCARERHAVLLQLKHCTFLPCNGASDMNAS